MPNTAVLQKQTIEKGEFYDHVLHGLTSETKKLHPKFFYDQKGSQYFDEICELEEYYPYRTELTLLPQVAKDLSELLGEDYSLIEFGAGSLLKVKPLLEQVAGIHQFIPIDISGEHLRESCRQLEKVFPRLDVQPVVADFTMKLNIPTHCQWQRLGFFPGSTIGNQTPQEARAFLTTARESLGDDSYLLVGVDTKKSPNILHRAYNDKQGTTAKFNLNILERINRYFDADIDLEKFEHYAFYNADKGCIEMHLVCLQSYSFYLGDVSINFEKGESIHTESSYKYAPTEFQSLAKSAGWRTRRVWLAEDDMFSVYLLHNG